MSAPTISTDVRRDPLLLAQDGDAVGLFPAGAGEREDAHRLAGAPRQALRDDAGDGDAHLVQGAEEIGFIGGDGVDERLGREPAAEQSVPIEHGFQGVTLGLHAHRQFDRGLVLVGDADPGMGADPVAQWRVHEPLRPVGVQVRAKPGGHRAPTQWAIRRAKSGSD